MPAPAIIGLPLLGAFLYKIGDVFLDFFLKKFTRRIALKFTYLALLATLFLGFAAVMQSVISGIHFFAPAPLSKAIGLFIPEITPVVISAYATVHLADFVMTIKVRLAKPAYGLY